MSLNVSCDLHANGVRLWCKQHESINPSCFLSAVQTGGVCVWRVCVFLGTFEASYRQLSVIWLSSSRTAFLNATITSLYRSDPLSAIASRSSRALLGGGETGDLHGRTADENEGQISGERLQHLVESTPREIKVCPVWR